MGITDDQYVNKYILPEQILPTNYVSYTDGIILSIKLLNGVVILLVWYEILVK